MLFEVLLLLGLHPFTSCTKHWSRKAFPVLILDSNSCHLACTWTNVKGTRMPTQAPTACPQDMRDIIRMVSPRPGGSYFWLRNQITQMSRSQAVLTPLQGDVGSSPPSTCISRVALWRHLGFLLTHTGCTADCLEEIRSSSFRQRSAELWVLHHQDKSQLNTGQIQRII